MDGPSADFKLRQNEEYLSFFEVADEDEGCRVGAAYRIVREERPDKIDFLLFARQLLLEAGIEVENKPDDCLPEYLSARHVGTRGPQHEPNLEFIIRLLCDESKIIKRLSPKEIEQLARSLLEESPNLRDHLGEHWRQKLSNE